MDTVFLQIQNIAYRFWDEPFWFFLLLITLLLLAIVIVLPRILDSLSERKRLAVFKRICHDSVHDIVVPDGLGGKLFIPHVLLMSDRVAVFDEKAYGGKIFGDSNVDQWTQTIGQGSYRFPNPLRELQSQVVAVNSLMINPCAKGYLVFSDDSEFPWGQPESVYLRKDLSQAFTDATKSLESSIEQAWASLQRASILAQPKKSYKVKYVLFALVLMMAVAWFSAAWIGAAPALQSISSL